MLRAGDEITVEPTELVAGGAALARVDGFPIFATSLYPGDVAVVRLREVKKGFARAEIVRLIRPSALRRLQPCSIAEECGGCDWTALRLDAQLAARQRILEESLRRIGKIEPATLPPIGIHPSPLNYRIRSRLHRDGDAVGFYAMGSHRVVPLAPDCEVVGVRTAQDFGGGQVIPPAPTGDGAGAPLNVWEIDGLVITTQSELSIRVGQFAYRLTTDAFFQVNRHLLLTMLRLVSSHAARVGQKRLAVDLYAGIGFFTLPLATLFQNVISVEGSDLSHRHALLNAPPNVDVIHEAVESFEIPSADFVFLDPPRAGAHRAVIDRIASRAREMICYLSCDPVTFSRDASRLIASGWRLSSLDLLDLFPNTHHVETLASFERAK